MIVTPTGAEIIAACFPENLLTRKVNNVVAQTLLTLRQPLIHSLEKVLPINVFSGKSQRNGVAAIRRNAPMDDAKLI